MSVEQHLCAVCAWRATCQKKFTLSGKDMRCVDFVRDVSIKSDEEEKKTDSADKSQS